LPPDREERLAALREDLRAATRGLGLSAEEAQAAAPSGARRAGRGPRGHPLLRLTLVDEDGVLRWVEGPAAPARARRRGGRAGRRLAGGAEGPVEVHALDFERLAPSEITAHLDRLDDKLTPTRGLRRWRDGALEPVAKPSAGAGERVLLVIHGTFSHGEAITDQLAAAPNGRLFLNAVGGTYAEVLLFDHPTLAVSPLLNAFDLERALAGCPATFDVVAHSRGGLVARAWAEAFRDGGHGVGRLALVGSPLAGTSLAAPPRLRDALEFLSNVGAALRTLFAVGGLNPFLAVGAGLMQVVTSITSLGARTPLLDAAVAMIPGLAAQSRVGNNPEVLRMRSAAGLLPAERCFAVRANFEPPPVGWAFWKLFVRPKERLADLGADLLFPGPNDLVVDWDSIVSLADGVQIPAARQYDFGTQSTVHHCNYFAQRATVDFLGRTLLGG
jgi:hypothetical protein